MHIIGSDEVGYGALAGPLMVCSVAVPEEWTHGGLKDSKAFTSDHGVALRARIAKELEACVFFRVEVMLARHIERLGARGALNMAHMRAIRAAQLAFPDARVIVDGDMPIEGIGRHEVRKKADTDVPAVMAAAIIAKVRRDRYMNGLAWVFPQFGFRDHAGYGTEAHRAKVVETMGSVVHRRNYNPLKSLLQKRNEHADDR